MLVQFDQESIDRLTEAFPEFEELKAMFDLVAGYRVS